MSNTNNKGLFPTMNKTEDVIEMAISKLPITTPNELMTILMTFQNTLLKEHKENGR